MIKLEEVKTKMQRAVETEYHRNTWQRVRCPSIAKMAEYVRAVFPDLKVRVEESEDTKDRPAGRLRIPGKTYYGKRIVVINRDGNKLLDHDSSETYRHNTEVARWILKREEELDGIKLLQAAGWKEVDGCGGKDWSPDERAWYTLGKALEIAGK